MIFSINNTISAIKAFGTKMGVHANNTANIETEGFKKSRTTFTANDENNIQVVITQVNTPGHFVIENDNGQMIQKELSNVDLAEEIPQTMLTKRLFESNLVMLKTYDEMLGSIIDILG